MANLKDLKNRIASVKSTRKITSAMKVVAASKLRRAQEKAEAGRPYSEKMERMLLTLAANTDMDNAPVLMSGREGKNGKKTKHLLIVVSADRGLCGGFNTNISKAAIAKIDELENAGEEVLVYSVGRKARDLIRYKKPNALFEHYEFEGKGALEFLDANAITKRAIDLFDEGAIDKVTVLFNKFVNALSQDVTFQPLVPMDVSVLDGGDDKAEDVFQGTYEYEPSESAILTDLIPRNIAIQLYSAVLESSASEHGARMTAMDNATRNAGEMIDKLTLVYNRTRQAAITTELTEIIAGAESV